MRREESESVYSRFFILSPDILLASFSIMWPFTANAGVTRTSVYVE